MGMRLTFDFYGDTQLDRTLARFAGNARDARPAWEKMADAFARSERRQFDSEGRYASGGWSPLSPRYAAWKARHFPGKGILVRTGELLRSLVERPFGVEHITASEMVIGSDVRHGEFHQKGDGPPRRRPVELTEADRREWVKMLQRHLVSEV